MYNLLPFVITIILHTVTSTILVQNADSTQDYYLSFTLSADCSISYIQILENDVWRTVDQNYDPYFAFDYNGVAFSDMLPISLKIVSTSSSETFLWGIITDLDTSSSFTSSETCDGTSAPTSPTPAPTTKSPTAPTTPYPTAESICIDEGSLEWRSYNNQIYLNGNRFNMKGLSWFGFETSNYNLYGLDYHDMDWYFDWMLDHGFNAIRLPFSGAFMRQTSYQGLYLEAVQLAGEKGILIMPDYHSEAAGAYWEGLDSIDQDSAVELWRTVANLLKDEWNVFMADIFNEPHDVSNSEWAQWISFCESAAEAIWSTGANWLANIQGTNWDCDVISCAWGENLEGVKDTGTTFDSTTYGSNRFVWSPHVYGGDVSGNYEYSESAWQSHWAYLVDGTYSSNEAAVVIGEFGTTYTGSMINWLDDLVTYLISIDSRNGFYWCLNPNSGDTGGLLQDDWTTEQTAKLAALDLLQPTPSTITYSAGTVCFSFNNDAAYTYDEDGNVSKYSTNDIIQIVAVGVIILAAICIGVGVVYYLRKRNMKKMNIQIKNLEAEEEPDTPKPQTPQTPETPDGDATVTEQANIIDAQ